MLKRKKQTKTLKKNKSNFLDLNFIIQKEIKQNRLRTKFKKNYNTQSKGYIFKYSSKYFTKSKTTKCF